jgi:hypothetical protein
MLVKPARFPTFYSFGFCMFDRLLFFLEGSSLLRKLSGFRSLDLYSPLACVGRRVWVWFGLDVLGMHHKSLKKSESDWYFIGRKLGVDRQQGVLANLSMSPAPGSLLVASVVLAIAV